MVNIVEVGPEVLRAIGAGPSPYLFFSLFFITLEPGVA
jgi:hypothetical protein